MKNRFILLICLLGLGTSLIATNFYVDPVSGVDTNNGLTWSSAVMTVTQATALAAAHIGVDDILVKGGSILFTAKWTLGITDNYYGSCKGDETTPSQRPLEDKDGNGIVEPWEFKYPTLLNSTYNGTAFASSSPYQFNGFTITHRAFSISTVSVKTFVLGSNLGVFTNNIFRSCNLSLSGFGATSTYGILFKALGTVSNCLFEKNQIVVSFTANASCYPLMEVAASGTTGNGTKVSNCIVRNNKVLLDYSGSTLSNSGAKGLMMSIAPGTIATGASTVSNCVIHNNEMQYIPNVGYPSLIEGATVYIQSSASTTDSLLHCTIANNKGILLANAGVKITAHPTQTCCVLNNLFWNNRSDGAVSNLVGSLTLGSISNNYTNGGGLTNNGSTIKNNVNTLDSLVNSPKFIFSTKQYGNTTDLTTEWSDWSLGDGSSLIGKGVATSISKDKDGNTFASPPSVGAYEYRMKTTPLMNWIQDLSALKTNTPSPIQLTASFNGSTATDTVSYSSSDTSVVCVKGSKLKIVGSGSALLTAKLASNRVRNAAFASQNVVVTPLLTLVSNISELNSAIATAKPSDIITMKDGIWSDANINFNSQANSKFPITLRAQTPGSVILNGASMLTFSAHNLIVDGLSFKDGAITTGAVVNFNSDSCLLSNTSILNYNPDSTTVGYYWVYFNGSYNRMSQCYFKGKNNGEPLVGNAAVTSRHNTVDHSCFTDVPRSAEIFRIWGHGGNEECDEDGAFFTIENNLIERIVGDGAEIISLKSNHNIVRYNTIRASVGVISGRSGNYNTIEGNFILGENAAGSGGVRVAGGYHRVVNNYISDVDRSGIILMTGEYIDSFITPAYIPVLRTGAILGRVPQYGQVRCGVFAHNTIVNSRGTAIDLGVSYLSAWNTKQMVLLPENNLFVNNLVINSKYTSISFPIQDKTPPFDFFKFIPNRFDGNIVFGGSLSFDTIPLGIKSINPLFVLDATGLYRPSPQSPVIDAGVNSDVNIDMDGQVRDAKKDIGADEYSSTALVRRPLTQNDIGPKWMMSVLTDVNTPSTSSSSESKSLISYNAIHHNLALQFTNAAAGNASFEMYNITGKLNKVFLNNWLSAGDQSFSFSTIGLHPGLYICCLKTVTGTKNVKIAIND